MDIEIFEGHFKDALPFKRSNFTLQGFSNTDLGGDLDGRKSTTGYIFTLGGTLLAGSPNFKEESPFQPLKLNI